MYITGEKKHELDWHLQIPKTLGFSSYYQRAVGIPEGMLTYFPAISAKSSLVDSCPGQPQLIDLEGSWLCFSSCPHSHRYLCDKPFSGSDSLQIQLSPHFFLLLPQGKNRSLDSVGAPFKNHQSPKDGTGWACESWWNGPTPDWGGQCQTPGLHCHCSTSLNLSVLSRGLKQQLFFDSTFTFFPPFNFIMTSATKSPKHVSKLLPKNRTEGFHIFLSF